MANVNAGIEQPTEGFVWDRKCNHCMNCMTRTFRTFEEFEAWLKDHDFEVRRGWKKIFEKNKKISVYWCKKEPKNRYVVNTPGLGQKTSDETCWYSNIEKGDL